MATTAKFDLVAARAERAAAAGPVEVFTTGPLRPGGTGYDVPTPTTIPWGAMGRILTTGRVVDFMVEAVAEDRRAEFIADLEALPAGDVNALFDAYRKHYGPTPDLTAAARQPAPPSGPAGA